MEQDTQCPEGGTGDGGQDRHLFWGTLIIKAGVYSENLDARGRNLDIRFEGIVVLGAGGQDWAVGKGRGFNIRNTRKARKRPLPLIIQTDRPIRTWRTRW